MIRHNFSISAPTKRKLRGYAFDPSLSLSLETAKINEVEYDVPWEEVSPGPIGEYVEVIDYDPTLGLYYQPLDLDHPYVLAENGLSPSESNPQFHQQMVYAVAMTTIKNFETALGRKVLWAPRLLNKENEYEEYVEKLRIYPHALRDANAYYSPNKKALLFGYFTSSPSDSTKHLPGSLVFTCLSHDIIAHETTHAILDGMQQYYNEPSNPDVLAFHEAFSDIIALFQHFTFPEVIAHQISQTRGNLSTENHLIKLAHEFGAAIGHYGSLRNALNGEVDSNGRWVKNEPNPLDYQNVLEPHARGSLLVAAVFEAFIAIYNNRISDLKRIATDGTGILPRGELHPDLIKRLAQEAAKTAKHVLHMCIRALDYCPPVDITFGDYLRAIITGDLDVFTEDPYSYRLSFIEAFRKRGIYPKNINTLSIESLSHYSFPEMSNSSDSSHTIISNALRRYMHEILFKTDRKEIYEISKKHISGAYEDKDNIIFGLHRRIGNKFDDSSEFSELTGLMFNANWPEYGIKESDAYGVHGPSFQVQNLRLVTREGADGKVVNQIVFSIIQKSGVEIKDGEFDAHFTPDDDNDAVSADKFYMKGGCTLIYDLDTLKLKYMISKPLFIKNPHNNEFEIDKERVADQYSFQNDESVFAMSEYEKYFGLGLNNNLNEPFYLLHQ